MTKAECMSKFHYHMDLAYEAACNGNWSDFVIEEARAELAFTYAQETAS